MIPLKNKCRFLHDWLYVTPEHRICRKCTDRQTWTLKMGVNFLDPSMPTMKPHWEAVPLLDWMKAIAEYHKAMYEEWTRAVESNTFTFDDFLNNVKL